MGDARYLADGLQNLGVTLRELKRDADARAAFEEALKTQRELGDEEGLAGTLTNLGSLAGDEGRFDEALAHYHEALRFDEAAGYKSGQAILLRNIGSTLHRVGRTDEARSWLDRAASLADELDDPERIASARLERAAVLEAAGAPAAALADVRAALAASQRAAEQARSDAVLQLQSRFETLAKERQIERLQHEATERELSLARAESERNTIEQAHQLEAARRRTAWTVASAALFAAGLLVFLFVFQRRTAHRLARQREELARALAELHDANADLKRLYARKSEWLGFAVHELRSPLFGIDGCCAEFEAGFADSASATIARIREAAGRMRHELDAWLEAERREQDSLELQPSDTDLGQLAVTVVREHQAAARAKQIDLRHHADSPAPVFGDARRLREVIDNLVSNALKFSPPGRAVTIRTGTVAARAWCEVLDEGPGLQAPDFERLFQPFTPLSARPTAGEPSTGLGLHGAHRRIVAHGGTLAAENRDDGGAVFRFALPMTKEVPLHA